MKKVLVANRGEIAVRIIRACRELGLQSVAVYSEADAAALHVQLADEAVEIGPAPPLESYLRIDRIIEAAQSCGAEGLHPGYGFLAENAALAEACARAGITFIGPSPEAMRVMGDKVASRARMKDAGAPLVPGTSGERGEVDAIVAAAASIEPPLMVKAAGGGGGKGMRIVRRREELADAVRAASREAQSAFGNPLVYVERYLENPRHVEIQVLADTHGNVVHLFERECSIQRRHQKLVEETPSTAVGPEMRAKMGAAAVAVAQAVDYVSAGTVEFLVDREGRFYFLEMNTRIQVEHPVTELVTGIDLVAWQIRIAQGEAIPFTQETLRQRGHAIECRLYAEDPDANFMPQAGRIARLEEAQGAGVRVDSGIYEGCEVTPHYDPILAKIITYGETREHARRRMVRALSETICLGIRTPLGFLRRVVEHEAFIAGETTTDFIDRHFRTEGGAPAGASGAPPDAAVLAAAIVDLCDGAGAPGGGATPEAVVPSPWGTLGAWRLGG